SVVSQELACRRLERSGELGLPHIEQTAYVFAVFPRPFGLFPRRRGGAGGHRRLLTDRGPDAQAAGATVRARAGGGGTAPPPRRRAPPAAESTPPFPHTPHPRPVRS